MGNKSSFRKLKSWWGGRPWITKHYTLHAGSANIELRGFSIGAPALGHPILNPTLEDRIDILEKNIDLLIARVNINERENEEKTHAIIASIEQERQLRIVEEEKQEKYQEEITATSNLYFWASTFCIAWGLLFSTIPNELAHIIK